MLTKRTTAIFCGLAFLLGGCGEGPVPTVPAATSPLEDFLGFGYHEERADELLRIEEGQQESFVRGCMAEAGFDYWPESPLVRAPDGTVTNQEGAENADRNTAYTSSLTPEPLLAYQLALHGRVPSEEISAEEMARIDEDGDGRIGFAEQLKLGCRGAATDQFAKVNRVSRILSVELAEMEETIMASGATKDGRAAWAECMNGLGYDGTTVREVEESQGRAIAEGRLTRENYDTIEPCNQHVRDAVKQARVVEETRFFEEHEELIRELAVRP